MGLLTDWFASLSETERTLLLGRDTDDALHHAFDSKRVVHAGNPGTPMTPADAAAHWEKALATPLTKPARQLAYIHIPFCQTKCLYCGFFQNVSEQSAEDKYIDDLVKELEMAADLPRFQSSLIHAVFIGGGTPTSLSPKNAARLLDAIHQCLPLANDAELTLEGRIHDLVPEKMDVWMAHGVNRMSLGVQSFHTKIRRQMNRIDDEETVLKNLAALKAYQQCAVIVDLIYGLPDQTMDIWLEDLAMLEEADVDGMDLYQLNVFEGSDLDRRIKEGRMSPAASTQEQADMYAAAADYVGKRAFQKMNVRHWRRTPRERSLYNIYTKEGLPMYPFGSGAGGNIDGASLMLHRALRPYEAMVAAGEKPIMGMMRQDPSQPMVNVVMHQLEQGYFQPGAAARAYPLLEGLDDLFSLWEERGLVTWNGVLYRLTTAGEFWQVNMAQTVNECIKKLNGGTPRLVKESVAAQDDRKGKKEAEGKGTPSPLIDAIMRLTGVNAEAAEAMASRIPPNIKAMLDNMPPAMLDMAARSMGPEALKKMMEAAERK